MSIVFNSCFEVKIFTFRNLPPSKSQQQQLTSPPSKSFSSNDIVATRTSEKASDGPLGDEQKKLAEKEKVTRGWLVPPSLKALPAVPGSAPLKQLQSKTPDVMTDGSQAEEVNPYEKFMPVPAVPNSAANLQQASRRPKDSLASVDLNVSPINQLAAKPTKASLHPPPAPAVPQQSLSSEDDKMEIRKKFKRCHGRCVQKQCLPVANLDVYYKCVDKCKQLCNP